MAWLRDSGPWGSSEVQAAVERLDAKPSARLATTANVALSGGAPNTLDGVALVKNDRVLVRAQTASAENGIYAVQVVGTGANGTWTRAEDADTALDFGPNAFVWVEDGATYADTGWVVVTSPLLLGTDPITWTQYTGLGMVNAGAGLTKTGSTLDVGAGAGIQVNADDVAVIYGIAGELASADDTAVAGVLAKAARADHVHVGKTIRKGGVTTTDATPTDALTFTLADLTAYHFRAVVSARRTDVAGRGFFERVQRAYREGGGVVLFGDQHAPVPDAASNGAWAVSLVVSGNNLVVRVTGAAGETVNWRVELEILKSP